MNLIRWAAVVASCFVPPVASADDPAASAVPPLPQAAFTVNDGWLCVRVTQAGKPLRNVVVRCLVGTHVWASGETDDDGCGEFPRPTASWCQIDFNLGLLYSFPVPITFLPDGTPVPTTADVRDGTAPCCQLPATVSARRPPADPPTDWPAMAAGAVLLNATLGLTYVAYRRFRPRPVTPPKTFSETPS